MKYRLLMLLFGMFCSAAWAEESPLLQAWQSVTGAESPVVLVPNAQYLRVNVAGNEAYLVADPVSEIDGRPLETWYSADRVILRLQDGRVAALIGTMAEWRQVSQLAAPDWRAAARAEAPLHWVRVRDVLPDYRYGVRDALTLRRIDAPDDSQLRALSAQTLTWFEETTEDGSLPPARYAVNLAGERAVVMYGEQCLTPAYCLTWQRWTGGQATK